MKRSAITILILSLCATSLSADTEAMNARCVSLEHVRGAWRMQIQCEKGDGAILLVDSGSRVTYRGEGIYAKSSQKDLEATYQSLVPKDEGSPSHTQQLG